MSDAPEPDAPEVDDSADVHLSPGEVPIDDPRPLGLRGTDSLLLVNTGDGKGKSSAAFGVMVRAIARGWNVAVVQFVKSGDWKVGEEQVGRNLGVTWVNAGDGFTWDSNDLEHDKALAREGWATAAEIIRAGDHHLVILDELTYHLNWGWVDADDVVATLVDRPRTVSVIVTGRDASEALIAAADTVTEMRKVKHAYDEGIAAKRGIDY
jgi:cob(I)alamin adenosyltransferase